MQVLRELCPVNEYRRVSASSLPDGLLSSGLTNKCYDALVACSGTPRGRVYLSVNLNRLDGNEIDQMPYCIAYEDEGPLASGVLVQHGSYHEHRTIPLPVDFHAFVQASGLYPLPTMPIEPQGPIADLNIPSQIEALETVVAKIRAHFPE